MDDKYEKYADERALVLHDLQLPRVNIDRKCWAKTPEERETLKTTKSIWKHNRRSKMKTHLGNPPQKKAA